MIDFSFIIPIYNVRKDYLNKSVESVLNQTVGNYELILVDDHSTNECALMCDQFSSRDNRVIVIHNEQNLGVSESRNIGIENANGKWLIFVDADDWVENNLLEAINEDLSLNSDLLVFEARKIFKSITLEPRIEDKRKYIRQDGSLQSLQTKILSPVLKGNIDGSIPKTSVWGKVFLKDNIVKNDIHFERIPYLEDSLFLQQYLNVCSQVCYIPYCGYNYRCTSGSAVNKYRPDAIQEQEKFLSLLFDYYHNCELFGNPFYEESLFSVVFLSFQIILNQFIYHKMNKMSNKERKKIIHELLSNEPFRNIKHKVHFMHLKFSHKIKYLCFKMHWYKGIVVLKDFYRLMKREESVE